MKNAKSILRTIEIILVLCFFTTIAFASGANDDPSGATEFYPDGSGTGSVNYEGDPVDWWVVYVSAIGDLKFTLDVPSGQDFDIEIYDSQAPDGFLGGSYGGAGSNETVQITMFYSGPYYAKVYTYGSSSGSYTISNEIIQPSKPDLIAYGISVSDTTVDPDQSVTVYWTAKNQGNASCGSTQQGVMWSTDSTITRSDTWLENEYLGGLSPDQSTPEAHTITIPSNAIPGNTYYIGIIADYDYDEDESDESNNDDGTPVAVTINQQLPDLEPYQRSGWDDTLVISNITGTTTFAGTIYDDENLYIDWGCRNSGDGDAGHFRYGLYIDNVRRFYVDKTSLAAGSASYVLDSDIGTLSAGDHTFKVVCDYDGEVSESDEGNNEYSRVFYITPRPEVISPPTSITGNSATYVDKSNSYTAGGASSNLGHSLQYQFDWGDGNYSAWGSSTQSHSWGNSSTYNIKARARCASHPTKVSDWSVTLKSVSVIWVPLSVSVNPGGTGSVTKNPDRPVGYSYGEIVQLTANANSGYIFDYWSGDASGSSNPISITMNSSKTITANFRSTPDIRIEPLTLDFESLATSAISHKDPNTIELRNRSFLPPSRIEMLITKALMSSVTSNVSQHFLIQFTEDVNAGKLRSIEKLGLKLVQYGSHRVFSVSGYPEQVTKAFERGIIRWAGRLRPEDKMPRMSLLFGSEEKLIEKPFLVTFHPDVSIANALEVLEELSLVSITNEFLGQSYLVTYGTSQDILLLATTDEVNWIQLCSQASADAVENGEQVYFCPGGLNPYGYIQPMWATNGPGWDGPGLGVASLTYNFMNHTSDISVAAQETACTDATAIWSQFAQITWTLAASSGLNQSVDIGWYTGSHGDGYPFDGSGGTLAHAFYPAPNPNPETIAGDMHFDDDDTWEIGDSGTGFDQFTIALHELGHSLGLLHSTDPAAVMRPSFSENTVLTTLHADDIAGIQSIYASGDTQDFTIYNDGAGILSVSEGDIVKENGSVWLSFTPVPPFDIDGGNSQVVTVSVDSTGLSPDNYSDRLLVYSNDPDENPYPGGVYVNLTIPCVSTTIEQPPQDITICEGQDAVFDIVATGSEPLQYQWKKDGVDVGIDSSELTLSNMQLADDGSEIWCEVTNACSTVVVSESAFLTVYPWPTVTVNPNPDQLNAAWILDGPNSYTYSGNGDETIADLEFGSYTITWSTIPSWNTPLPNPDTKNLSVGNSINFIGNYELIGDLYKDYYVDVKDLEILVMYWLTFEPSINMSGDDFIDFSDFAVFAEHWHEGLQ